MDQAAKISLAEAVIGHMFQNKNLIWEAIQAPGRTNERLALIGDAALRLFHHQQGYRNGLSKGQSSIRHDAVANNLHLAEIGYEMNFNTFINRNISHAGGISANAMAATVEAVIGAAYLDGGIVAAATVITALGLQ